MPKHRIWILIVCLAVVGVFGPSVLAQDTHFKIYAGPAYVAPMSDDDITLSGTSRTIKAEKRVGWNFGVEGRFGKLMGVEVDYVNAKQDVNIDGVTIGDANFSPLTATLDFHVINTKVVDLYLGPSYSYVNWGDIHLNANGSGLNGSSPDLNTDSAHGWGASLGVDIGIGKHFAIEGGLKYLNVDLEIQNGPTATVNPLVARLGVAVRF